MMSKILMSCSILFIAICYKLQFQELVLRIFLCLKLNGPDFEISVFSFCEMKLIEEKIIPFLNMVTLRCQNLAFNKHIGKIFKNCAAEVP